MAAETGYFRGENGLILEMDLPLGDAYAGRLNRGELVRVADADGTPWVESEPQPTATPAGDDGTAAQLAEALDRIAELEAELELASRQRDALAVELGELKAAPVPTDSAEPAKAAKTAGRSAGK